jgi:hypothetical protein
MRGAGDDLLRLRFDELANGVDDSDWQEVVSRAGLGRPRSRLRGRWVFLALAVAAAFLLGFGVSIVYGSPFRHAKSGPPGPTQVDRPVHKGTISWLYHHRLRGESLAAARIGQASLVGANWQPVQFARAVRPDPAMRVVIVLSLIGKRGRNLCMTAFMRQASGGGCGLSFRSGPLNYSIAYGPNVAGSDATLLVGLATDEVARIELFRSHDGAVRVPLKDNTFVVRVANRRLPVRLVAYDETGRIIGISEWGEPPTVRPG